MPIHNHTEKLGIYLPREGDPRIVCGLVPGSQAEVAGIQTGDLLTSVSDAQSTSYSIAADLSKGQIFQLIQGLEFPITLTISRGSLRAERPKAPMDVDAVALRKVAGSPIGIGAVAQHMPGQCQIDEEDKAEFSYNSDHAVMRPELVKGGQALYTHSDGRQETVDVLKLHSEAEGDYVTIMVPSVGHEKQTTPDRLSPQKLSASQPGSPQAISSHDPLSSGLLASSHNSGCYGNYFSSDLGTATSKAAPVSRASFVVVTYNIFYSLVLSLFLFLFCSSLQTGPTHQNFVGPNAGTIIPVSAMRTGMGGVWPCNLQQ